MNAFSIAVLFALAAMAAASSSDVLYDLNNAEPLFDKFVKDYNRTYKDDADRQAHFEAFKKNLASINEQNKAQQHASFGINKFADYTDEEKKQMRGFKKN